MRLGVPPPAALAPPALAFLTGRPRGALVAVVFAVAAIIAFLRRGGDAAPAAIAPARVRFLGPDPKGARNEAWLGLPAK